MFHLIIGIPWLVVALRFIQPLPWLWPVKLLVAGVLLVASQYYLVNRLSSGSVFAPEFPRPLILLFNLLLGTVILLFVFQVILDAGTLLLAIFKGGFPVIAPEIRYGIGILALGLSAYGVSQAARVPPVKTIEVEIAGLAPSFDGYRIIQLTDLHLSRLFTADWAREVVARANALEADMTVITGDFIDGTLEAREDDVAPLSGLRAAMASMPFPAITNIISAMKAG